MRNKILAALLAAFGLASSSGDGSGTSAPSFDLSASLQNVAQVAASTVAASVLHLAN